ncbi:hypothetical protein PGTUg99_028123 [Puccinia graminis f. sp. tritici]|uniref:Uncharacterized protein n=1 Tax=Puccinia graminis f. sp. tritici TaxID=56615 RepID=A0A5B0QQV0_PUCGR|nr:hypothetical protein PGTUg99_028123 [Puccinia graminis f. sp. tritici]
MRYKSANTTKFWRKKSAATLRFLGQKRSGPPLIEAARNSEVSSTDRQNVRGKGSGSAVQLFSESKAEATPNNILCITLVSLSPPKQSRVKELK